MNISPQPFVLHVVAPDVAIRWRNLEQFLDSLLNDISQKRLRKYVLSSSERSNPWLSNELRIFFLTLNTSTVRLLKRKYVVREVQFRLYRPTCGLRGVYIPLKTIVQ